MTSTRYFCPQSPTNYKARFEREQHRRQALEGRVEALELERDALKWRLHVAQKQLLDKP